MGLAAQSFALFGAPFVQVLNMVRILGEEWFRCKSQGARCKSQAARCKFKGPHLECDFVHTCGDPVAWKGAVRLPDIQESPGDGACPSWIPLSAPRFRGDRFRGDDGGAGVGKLLLRSSGFRNAGPPLSRG